MKRTLLEDLDDVHKVFPLRERSPSVETPDSEEENDEEAVDDRGRGLEEIVVVRRDELSQLIDEEAQADAADHSRHRASRRADEGEQNDDCHEHQKPTPKQVGDVKPLATELWIVRQPQLRAHDEDRRYRTNERRIEQPHHVDGSDWEARERSTHLLRHGSMLPGFKAGPTRRDRSLEVGRWPPEMKATGIEPAQDFNRRLCVTGENTLAHPTVLFRPLFVRPVEPAPRSLSSRRDRGARGVLRLR